MNKIFIAFFLFIGFASITSCKKEVLPNPEPLIQQSARETLKSKMSNEDYSNLNWKEATVIMLNGKELFVEIPTINDISKKLVYTLDGQNEVYNYYELKITTHNKQAYGSLVLSAIDNTILHKYFIENNKIVNSSVASTKNVNSLSIKKHTIDDLFLPDVVVKATLNNNLGIYVDYISLYWLFNGLGNYSTLYSNFGDQTAMDANAPIAGNPTYYSVQVTTLANGHKQFYFNNTHAFALSGLDITFTIDPNTQKLDDQSVVSVPAGGGRLGSPFSVFIGSWTQSNITGIYNSGNYLGFTINARNSVSLGMGGNVNSRYSLNVEINLSTNVVGVTWN